AVVWAWIRPIKKGSLGFPCEIWSGKSVSNRRPQPWQGCALPTELFPHLLSFTHHFRSAFRKDRNSSTFSHPYRRLQTFLLLRDEGWRRGPESNRPQRIC